jgi:hypothetical protein
MRTMGLLGLSALVTSALCACSSSSTVTTGTGDDGGGNQDAGLDSGHQAPDATRNDSGKVGSDATTGPDAKPGIDSSVGPGDAGGDVAADAVVVASDAGDAALKLDAAPAGPAHLLVTFTGATTSETVAVNVTTKAVDGRIPFSGFGVTDARNTTSPFLLEQNADVVAKLDATDPWKIDATWNVALTDVADGGSLYSDPYQVVVEASNKAYVLRYERNDIAVIDESASAEGGVPTSSINISKFVQAGDSDGVVEMTAAAYVPATHMLYVVLANINQATQATAMTVVCPTGGTSTLIGIDTTTDTIATLPGSAANGSIALTYYDPTSMVYDATGDRLIIVSAGCSPSTGGVLGAPTLRGVEQIALATGKSTSLIELTSSMFPVGFNDLPTGFVYIDSTHAVLGFDQTGEAVYAWNPTQATLGNLIPNAPDVFTYDGNGHLLGARADVTDAGVAKTDIVSVTVPAGVSTTLATNVTSLSGASYVSSVDVWPHP